MAHLRLEKLCKKLGTFELKHISLTIERGDYVLLAGPTGAGKTSLLEIIAGLELPSSGQVWIDEDDVTSLPPQKRDIGFVYQGYSLFPHLSVRENIVYGLAFRNVSKEGKGERLNGMIEMLRLEDLIDREDPDSLSGGQKQKVALARALIINPQILLLDEPMTSLDKAARRMISALLQRINQQMRMTIIHVTHDYEEALDTAQTVALMKDGEIVKTGSPDEVIGEE